MRNLRLFFLIVLVSLLVWPAALAAQDSITITHRDPFVVFPDRISFNAQITSRAPITEIVLEYGVDKRTCGDVTARAFPTFTSDTTVDAHWTWEMLNTGSEPPGATVWYRWRATDEAGHVAVSDTQRVVWLDKTYNWQQLTSGDLTLHWYRGDSTFARTLLDTAVEGIERLRRFTGVTPQNPIDLYIYGNTIQMQEAILYEPNWTGGVAFPANNITIIGISPNDAQTIAWGQRTIIHELTHLIVGQMTFSCGENVPTWLDEGIAVYAEGGLDGYSQYVFDEAVLTNSLLPVRAISSGFSQHPDLADLSYSQSFSMVSYLIETYGSAKLLALLANLRAGMTVEAGVQAAYGFDLEGLEDRWRAWLRAAPRSRVVPTATPAPSPVATLPVVVMAPTGPPIAPTPTLAPTAVPTATPLAANNPPAAQASAPRRSSTLPIVAAVSTFLIGLGLTVLAAWKLLH